MFNSSEQENDKNLPAGLRTKRRQQRETFNDGIKPAIERDYGLTNAQIDAAIGNPSNHQSVYDASDRRALKQMDKFRDDYINFQNDLIAKMT